jgi:hypothetical protein
MINATARILDLANPKAKPMKLDGRQVNNIRRMWNAKGHPWTLRSLAEHFGVAIPTISHIVYGITHKKQAA